MTMSHDPAPGGYEKSDVRPKPILISGGILAVVTILVLVAAYGMMRLLGWWERPRLETPASPLATRSVPIEPRLQVEAPKELKALQRAEQEILTSYAWVSKEAGIVRIPVDRAMQFVLERGLAALKPAASATPPVKGDAR